MNNLVDQNTNSIELLNNKIDNLISYMSEMYKQNKLIANKLVDISLHLGQLKGMNDNNEIKDGLNVLAKEIAQLHNINDCANLSGKDIYYIRQKTGISWAKMSIKYNIPVSTLQYRYRRYRDQFDKNLTECTNIPINDEVQ